MRSITSKTFSGIAAGCVRKILLHLLSLQIFLFEQEKRDNFAPLFKTKYLNCYDKQKWRFGIMIGIFI